MVEGPRVIGRPFGQRVRRPTAIPTRAAPQVTQQVRVQESTVAPPQAAPQVTQQVRVQESTGPTAEDVLSKFEGKKGVRVIKDEAGNIIEVRGRRRAGVEKVPDPRSSSGKSKTQTRFDEANLVEVARGPSGQITRLRVFAFEPTKSGRQDVRTFKEELRFAGGQATTKRGISPIGSRGLRERVQTTDFVTGQTTSQVRSNIQTVRGVRPDGTPFLSVGGVDLDTVRRSAFVEVSPGLRVSQQISQRDPQAEFRDQISTSLFQRQREAEAQSRFIGTRTAQLESARTESIPMRLIPGAFPLGVAIAQQALSRQQDIDDVDGISGERGATLGDVSGLGFGGGGGLFRSQEAQKAQIEKTREQIARLKENREALGISRPIEFIRSAAERATGGETFSSGVITAVVATPFFVADFATRIPEFILGVGATAAGLVLPQEREETRERVISETKRIRGAVVESARTPQGAGLIVGAILTGRLAQLGGRAARAAVRREVFTIPQTTGEAVVTTLGVGTGRSARPIITTIVEAPRTVVTPIRRVAIKESVLRPLQPAISAVRTAALQARLNAQFISRQISTAVSIPARQVAQATIRTVRRVTEPCCSYSKCFSRS